MHRNKQGSNQRQGRSMDDLYQCHQQAHRDVGWNGVGKLLHRVFLALVSLIHRPAQHPDSFDTMQREQKLRGAMRIQVVHAQQSSLVFDTLPVSLLRGMPPGPFVFITSFRTHRVVALETALAPWITPQAKDMQSGRLCAESLLNSR